MIDSQVLRRARFRSKILRRPLVWSRHLGIQPQDVILASYPRSGTTWMRFLLAEALSGRSAEFKAVRGIVPYVGQHRKAEAVLPGGGKLMYSHDVASKDATRRAIYVVRDVARRCSFGIQVAAAHRCFRWSPRPFHPRLRGGQG